jgi:diguanylate cyclase (GGDEF)-like protein/PAS domain S-box-containing protein
VNKNAEDGRRVEDQLAHETAIRKATLDNMDQGLLVVDASMRVVAHNRRLVEMFGYLETDFNGNPDFEDILRTWVELGGHGPEMLRQALEDARSRQPMSIEIGLPDGRVIDIRHRPLAGGGLVRTFTDITDRKRAEQALATERMFLQNIVDSVPEPITVIGEDYGVRLLNRAARQRLGRFAPGSRPIFCYSLLHGFERPCPDAGLPCPAEPLRRGEKQITVEHLHVDQGGEERVIELSATPLWDTNGSWMGLVESWRDITELRRSQERLLKKQEHFQHLAHHDPLTGLPNRLLLRDRLEQAILKVRRNRAAVALLFVDLDEFKAVNDAHGHPVGDELLSAVAQRLKQCVRQGDTVARVGGDEFTVVLEDIHAPNSAALVARAIVDTLAHPFDIGRHRLHVSASVGISLYPADGDELDALLSRADRAMFRAKQQGGGSYCFYSEALNRSAARHLALATRLRKALEHGELQVVYQPEVDPSSGAVAEVEARGRWSDPDFGVFPHSEFVSIAEEGGLAVPIGDWLIRSACRQTRAWQESGSIGLRALVALSPAQLRQQDLSGVIADALHETGLKPEWLELTLRETDLARATDGEITAFAGLRGLGVHLGVDDFGVGGYPLDRLFRLPVGRLRLAPTLLRDAAQTEWTGVHALIQLAHSLGLQVGAKGIESRSQLAELRAAGCDLLQGPTIAPARSATEFPRGTWPLVLQL